MSCLSFFEILSADVFLRFCRRMINKVIHAVPGSILNRFRQLVILFEILSGCSLIFLLVFSSQVDKRAHHNALERKRRDHIKDSFSGLRDSVPSLQGEKVLLCFRISSH